MVDPENPVDDIDQLTRPKGMRTVEFDRNMRRLRKYKAIMMQEVKKDAMRWYKREYGGF